MTDWQPTERQSAIISLLEILYVYEGMMPMALKCRRYSASTQEPGPPAPPWTHADCDGRCLWNDERYPCEWVGKCRGELWQVEREKLRRRYRIEAVYVALWDLYVDIPPAFRAIVAEYVDPYDPASEPLNEWHRERRRAWARTGIDYMDRAIRGDVVAFGERRDGKACQIYHMLEAGYSWRAIAKEVKVSKREIGNVKREMVVR